MYKRIGNQASKSCKKTRNNVQTHVHEFASSTTVDLDHNHRFAGVTSQEIPLTDGDHIHVISVNTDFTIGHLHEVGVETGPAIEVGNGKHVHFVEGITTLNRDHIHGFAFATLVDDPIG